MIHPILPAGYNEDPNAGDELNGAGTNEAIWPVFINTFTPMEVFLINEDMLEVFETGCPDYVVPGVNRTIVFPCEFSELVIRRRA
ncbi:MAG TPA: hypothetical protein VFQ15_10630 [Jiangellaceae bacterium]|nr:hypothetical protein [Jiangellaceae bacterium]